MIKEKWKFIKEKSFYLFNDYTNKVNKMINHLFIHRDHLYSKFHFLINLLDSRQFAFETLKGSSSITGLLIYLKEFLSSSNFFSYVSKNSLMSKFLLYLPTSLALESAYLYSLNWSLDKINFWPFINSTITRPLTKNETFGYRTD